MPRYSIIVPVYNVALYLRECLDSILAQDSPSEYEVILVDDGSTDNSGAICDEYAEKYPQFRVIHQKNQGVSAARNAGLDIACGEYALFVDGDDLCHNLLLSRLDSFAESAPDMIAFGFREFDEDAYSQEVSPIPSDGQTGLSWLDTYFSHNQLPIASACSYCFRLSFLKKNALQFYYGRAYAEDFEFSLHCIEKARLLYAMTDGLYFYRQHSRSAVHVPKKQEFIDNIEVIVSVYERFPNAAVAKRYCQLGMSLPKYGARRETRELVRRYAAHSDLLKKTPGITRVTYCLYRTFGYYNGAKAALLLVRMRQLRFGGVHRVNHSHSK